MFTRIKQRGFILAEFAIGLPLLMLGLWAIGHLFSSTWTTCRHLIADFTLQMEVRNAMSRIVTDMRTAQRIVPMGKTGIIIHSYLIDSSNKIYVTLPPKHNSGDEDRDTTLADKRQPVLYFGKTVGGLKKIYRQRSLDRNDHPITGEDILSNVEAELIFDWITDRLCGVTIEAKSNVSKNKFKLTTKVFLEGGRKASG